MADVAAATTGDKNDQVAAYKRLLQEVLDRRPSGTRQRLADALKRNRSFITQIANPAYTIPVPARHVATIFDVCHFSPAERTAFLESYHKAHPRSLVEVSNRARGRHVHLVLPDLGSDRQNRAFDELLEMFIRGVARVASPKGDE
jgi:hypothetical protein